MSVPVIPSGGDEPILPLSDPEDPPPSSPLQNTTDTISSSAPLTIVQFSRIINSAINESRDIIWQTQQYNATSRNSFYRSLVLEFLNLAGLHNIARGLANQAVSINGGNQNAINSLNDFIDEFNGIGPPPNPTSQLNQDQEAIGTMNQAIGDYNQAVEDYNNGVITEAEFNAAEAEFNAALASYNAYVTTRNNSQEIINANHELDTFNENVAILNPQLISINNQLLEHGFAPYSTQRELTAGDIPAPYTSDPPGSPGVLLPEYIPSSTSPLATIPVPTPIEHMENTISPPPVGVEETTSQIFSPIFDLLVPQFIASRKLLTSQSTYLDFVQFILQGIIPVLPAAFITPDPAVSMIGGGRGIGQGSGASLTSMVTTLSNPLLKSILNEAMVASDRLVQIQPRSPALVKQLQFLSLTLLSQLGLLAGSSAVRLLAGRLASLDERSSPVLVALGLSFANEVSEFIASGKVREAVLGLLTQTFPDIPANNLAALADKLASAVELFLLQVGIFQLAAALGKPELFAQLLATSASDVLEPAPSFSSIFSDQESVRSIRDTVASNLSRELNLDTGIADEIVNQAIGNATQTNGITNETAFREAIRSALVQRGINETAAINASILAASVAKSELMGRDILNDRVTGDLLNRATLNNELAGNLVRNNEGITVRELRDQLASAFLAPGVPLGTALIAATVAIVGTPPPEPLSTDQLKAELLARAVRLTEGAGSEISQNIGNQLIASLFAGEGARPSVQELLGERLRALAESNDKEVVAQLRDDLKSFLTPTINLFDFAERFRDPANTFLITAKWSITQSQREPTNYLKDVDIRI